ncbi:MAG: transaldolase family protein, partial [Chloroflexota bacterium]
LIGPDTVCTVSPAGLSAFRDHGQVSSRLAQDIDQAQAIISNLDHLGIDLELLGTDLQERSLANFERYYQALVHSVSNRRNQLERSWRQVSTHLGRYEPEIEESLEEFCEARIVCRIWAHDYTVWQEKPQEIANRLGWLHIVEAMRENLDRLSAFALEVQENGFDHVVVLGMGGSSLAPELLAKTFAPWARLNRPNSPQLALTVLDTTDPDAIISLERQLDLRRTLFIVASKSGTTVETLSAFKYFYNQVESVCQDQPGQNFVAITDPGTALVDLAERHNFRTMFLNDPSIGGRYSALSYFGLAPAVLTGVDIDLLLDHALGMVVNSHSCNCPMKGDNLAAQLGMILGQMALRGRNKLTLIASPPIQSFVNWIEQLVAESTGKHGVGILPIVGEALGPPHVYGDDRLFVHLRLDGDRSHDAALAELVDAGQPVIVLHLRDMYDIGGQFFVWEMAAAIAGHFLAINPFDQPDVEAAKELARQLMAGSESDGRRPAAEFSDLSVEVLNDFLARASAGDYVAIQAYVCPTAAVDDRLHELQCWIRDGYRVATTVGYGPRYLHSTGQYHKGGPASGHFVQFVSEPLADRPIPDRAGSQQAETTFGMLKKAQAAGDAQALLNAGRKIIRFQLSSDTTADLDRLLEGMKSKTRGDMLQPA